MGNSHQNISMNPIKLLPAATFAARQTHTATLIFLHGLGDDGHGWASILREIIPDHCKLICPHSQSMPVTLNGGMRMPSWFDIYGLDIDAKQDEPGLVSASDEVDKFIASELQAGIPINRIVIGGFSQGGAVALYNALTHSRQLGGIVALSSWLPLHMKFLSNPSMAVIPKSSSIFQCHGLADCVIPHPMGEATHHVLKGLGLDNCEFKSYPNLSHCSGDEEMCHLREFLNKKLSSD